MDEEQASDKIERVDFVHAVIVSDGVGSKYSPA